MSFFEQVFGNLTHNNAAPGATNLGALVAVASSAAPTYNAGDQVLLSVDLLGNVRTIITNTPSVVQSGVWSVEVNDGTNVVFTVAHPAYVQGTVAAIQSGTWTVTSEIVGHAGIALDAVIGAAHPANVLQVGGNDGTNAYAVPLASGGASVVVSGIVTAAQGTAATLSAYWPVGISDGTNLIGVSSHPLYVQFASAPSVTSNITQWATTTLGAPTAYGTPPSGNVIGVNAYVTTLPAVTVAAAQTIAVTNAGTFAVQASGTVTAEIVGNAGGIFDAVAGAAVPANVLQIGGSDGTHLRPIATDASGNVQVDYENADADSVMYATWTSATAVNTTLTGSIVGYGNCGFSVIIAGIISIGVIIFEISPDGTNWLPISVQPLNGTTGLVSSYSLTGGNNAWQMFVGGFYSIRIRLSTAITGAGSAKVCVHPSVVGTEFAQYVFQPSGSNLHVAVDSLPSLAAGSASLGYVNVTASLPAYTYTYDGSNIIFTSSHPGYVQGTVTADVVGHAGIALDSVLGATKPANAIQVSGNDGANAYAIPLASGGGSVVITGTLTHNNAAPAAINVGALTSIANANPPSNTEGDQVLNSQDLQGSSRIRPGSPKTANWLQAVISVSALGANVIIPAVGGQTIRVMRMFFVNSDAANTTLVTIQDTTPTSFSGAFRLIVGGSFNGSDSNGEPLYVSAIGQGIQLNSSVAVQLSGTIWYTQS